MHVTHELPTTPLGKSLEAPLSHARRRTCRRRMPRSSVSIARTPFGLPSHRFRRLLIAYCCTYSPAYWNQYLCRRRRLKHRPDRDQALIVESSRLAAHWHRGSADDADARWCRRDRSLTRYRVRVPRRGSFRLRALVATLFQPSSSPQFSVSHVRSP